MLFLSLHSYVEGYIRLVNPEFLGGVAARRDLAKFELKVPPPPEWKTKKKLDLANPAKEVQSSTSSPFKFPAAVPTPAPQTSAADAPATAHVAENEAEDATSPRPPRRPRHAVSLSPRSADLHALRVEPSARSPSTLSEACIICVLTQTARGV